MALNAGLDASLRKKQDWKRVQEKAEEAIIIIIMPVELFVGPWPLFQFLDPIHSR
jgi:hypothetical protein